MRVILPAAVIATVVVSGHLAGVWPHVLEPLIPERVDEVGPPDPPPNIPVPEEDFDVAGLLIDRPEIKIGGPAKDAIPALSRPKVAPIRLATYLDPDDRVVGLTIGDESRAYPLRVLTWHEAINDELGGVPILVVYCPLCDSVSVHDRRLDDRTYEFGISGLLYKSNVLLFDRADEALWSQIAMQAVSGPNAGRSLRAIDGWQLTTTGAWRSASPESTVLTLATGHRRDYDLNPYVRLQETDELLVLVRPEDDRLPRKTRIVGVRVGETTRAYPVALVAASGPTGLRDTLEGVEVHLRAVDDGVEIVEMPDGADVVHAFWFSWAAAHPGTEIAAATPAS